MTHAQSGAAGRPPHPLSAHSGRQSHRFHACRRIGGAVRRYIRSHRSTRRCNSDGNKDAFTHERQRKSLNPRAAQCDPTPPQRRADKSLPGCRDFPQTAARRGAPAIPRAWFYAFATGFAHPANHEKSLLPTEFRFLDTPFQM
ncbi:hypothetical protein [Burkholderia sp. BCC1993]|uniref:hypothetical protein n=1 Tax=Burkholderia sp. BCC1993 TaxID=2817444 RepID=UPI002AAF9705|nr:hypothetical protein [Burkholderia sp. BCC1993]